MFALYTALIRHGGKLSYQVSKKNLTAPEIVVLRAIHGSDCIVNLKKTGVRNAKMFSDDPDNARLMSNGGELDRLRTLYNDFKTDDEKPIIDVLWPGFNPQLPLTIDGLSASEAEVAKELA
jgi:hypothetical protein